LAGADRHHARPVRDSAGPGKGLGHRTVHLHAFLSVLVQFARVSKILGISAFYHDSAACLVVDGEIIAAAQEERFTRLKHDHNFPANAVRYCLREAGISPNELNYIGFYDKPLLKFDRLLETYLD